MQNERVPKIKKLVIGGDFYGWEAEVKSYFQSVGLWDHVLNDEEIETEEDATETPARLSAKCRRIMLLTLDEIILLSIRHLESPHEMFSRVKKMFVGTEHNQKRKLRILINSIKFESSYFEYLSKYAAGVSQLDALNGVHSYKDLALQFLHNLPRTIASVTHPLKRTVEDSEEDDFALWITSYDAILDYCVDAGLYDASVKPEENSKASNKMMKAKVESSQGKYSDKKKRGKNRNRARNKKSVRCYVCDEEGHFASKCPQRKRKQNEGKSQESNQTQERNWSACTVKESSEDELSFILDSGATKHSCGSLRLFSGDLNHFEKKQVIQTANGIVQAERYGHVKVELENGARFTFKDTYYWKGAPNLLSIGVLSSKGFQVEFTGDEAFIMSPEGEEIYKAKRTSEGIYRVKFKDMFPDESQRKKCIYVSRAVWHLRLNHCSDRRLNDIVGTELEDKNEFRKESCVGCMQGKSKREPIKIRSKERKDRDVLELLHADCVGPYDQSIDRKRGGLTVTDTGRGFIWFYHFTGNPRFHSF